MSVATPPFAPSTATRAPSSPEPSWEIAKLFPCQGQWSAGDYLSLKTNHLVELSDRRIDVLDVALPGFTVDVTAVFNAQ